jgi:hypothetical protein
MEDVTMTTTTASNNITTEPTGSSASSSRTENGKENDNNTEKKQQLPPPIWLRRLVENDCSGGRMKRSANINRNYAQYLDTTTAKPRPRRKSQPPQKFVPPTTTAPTTKKSSAKGKQHPSAIEKTLPKDDSKATTSSSFKSRPNRTSLAMMEEDPHLESFFDFCEKEAFSAAAPLRELYRRFRASQQQQQEEKSVVV